MPSLSSSSAATSTPSASESLSPTPIPSSSTFPQSRKAKRKQAHHQPHSPSQVRDQGPKYLDLGQTSFERKTKQVSPPVEKKPMAPEETNNAVAAAPPAGSIFLMRVSNLPLVSSAVGQARQLYEVGKARYPGLTNNIETSVVNHVLPAVLNVSKPLVTAYDVRLHQIDSLACTGLDALEQRIPIIKQNPNEIIANGKSLLPQVHSVADMREALSSTIATTSSTLSSSLSGAATRSLHQVEHVIDNTLQISETTVDRLLPSVRPCAEEVSEHGKTTLARVTGLGVCVSHRLSSRIRTQLNGVRLRSPSQLKDMAFTVDLIHYAQQSLEHQAAWLQASLIAPAAERVHKAAQPLRNAVHVTSDASVRLVGVILSRLHDLTPAAVKQQTAATREVLLARIAAVKKSAETAADEAHVRRVLDLTEEGIAYVKGVGAAVLEYYNALRMRATGGETAADATNGTYFDAPEGRNEGVEQDVDDEEEDGEITAEEEEDESKQ